MKFAWTRENHATCRLEVIDQGIGIRESDLGRLFVPFQQLDSGITKKYPGAGLGLALVRHMMEVLGGQAGCQQRVWQRQQIPSHITL